MIFFLNSIRFCTFSAWSLATVRTVRYGILAPQRVKKSIQFYTYFTKSHTKRTKIHASYGNFSGHQRHTSIIDQKFWSKTDSPKTILIYNGLTPRTSPKSSEIAEPKCTDRNIKAQRDILQVS